MPRVIRPSRTALTLVELLVVITILVILVAVVLPLAKPATEGRALREAAREVSTIIAAAQTRAVAEGRIVGVQVHRDTNDPSIAYRISLVEFPRNGEYFEALTPYRLGSYGVVLSPDDWTTLRNKFPSPPARMQVLVQVGTKGLFCIVSGRDYFQQLPAPAGLPGILPGTPISLLLLRPVDGTCDRPGHGNPPSSWPAANLFTTVNRGTGLKFYFPTARRRVLPAPSVELPVGTYIDINLSGVGVAWNATTQTYDPSQLLAKFPSGPATSVTDPAFYFDPRGSVKYVMGELDVPAPPPASPSDPPVFNNIIRFQDSDLCGPWIPTQSLHFLLGRTKRKTDPLENMKPDAGSYWISVNHETGAVSTTASLGSRLPPTAPLENRLAELRSSAMSGIQVGGN